VHAPLRPGRRASGIGATHGGDVRRAFSSSYEIAGEHGAAAFRGRFLIRARTQTRKRGIVWDSGRPTIFGRLRRKSSAPMLNSKFETIGRENSFAPAGRDAFCKIIATRANQ
jgi:hypothetical protein